MKECKNCKKMISEKRVYCSRDCYTEYNTKIIQCKCCNVELKIQKSSNRIYCSNQCAANDLGVSRRNKAKQTLIEKYGVTHQSQLNSVKDKIKKKRDAGAYDGMVSKIEETLEKKYGNKNAFRFGSDEFKENLNIKYGNENYNNREKYKKTMIDKYGVSYFPENKNRMLDLHKKGLIGFGSERFKQYLKNAGIKNVSQLDDVKEKKRITAWKRMYDKFDNTNRLGNVKPSFSIEEYTGSSDGRFKKYKFLCLTCNNEFEDSLYSGHVPRCKICHPTMTATSYIEKEIVDYLKSIYSGIILENDRTILNGLELDIYIPEKNISIEFDGLYWHSDLNGKDKKYHLNKTLQCENTGIQLIHIFEDEWLNKQNIVKKKLKHILGENTTKIYARKCRVEEISTKIKNDFLNETHIQGEDKSKIKIGAYYDNLLVAVMTFGHKRLALGNTPTLDEYELIRFATCKTVIGIAGKLLNYFVKNYNPTKIISYADRRWSQGNLYKQLGFEKISNGVPNYWYIDNSFNRVHRFNFRKNVLNEKLKTFDATLTEWENMQLNEYDRIWDCGSLKYVWKPN